MYKNQQLLGINKHYEIDFKKEKSLFTDIFLLSLFPCYWQKSDSQVKINISPILIYSEVGGRHFLHSLVRNISKRKEWISVTIEK